MQTIKLDKDYCQSWLDGAGTLTLTDNGLLRAVFTSGGASPTQVVCVDTVQTIRRRIEDRLRKDERAVLETAAALGILPKQQV